MRGLDSDNGSPQPMTFRCGSGPVMIDRHEQRGFDIIVDDYLALYGWHDDFRVNSVRIAAVH